MLEKHAQFSNNLLSEKIKKEGLYTGLESDIASMKKKVEANSLFMMT